jgi:hypothetical protein
MPTVPLPARWRGLLFDNSSGIIGTRSRTERVLPPARRQNARNPSFSSRHSYPDRRTANSLLELELRHASNHLVRAGYVRFVLQARTGSDARPQAAV